MWATYLTIEAHYNVNHDLQIKFEAEYIRQDHYSFKLELFNYLFLTKPKSSEHLFPICINSVTRKPAKNCQNALLPTILKLWAQGLALRQKAPPRGWLCETHTIRTLSSHFLSLKQV